MALHFLTQELAIDPGTTEIAVITLGGIAVCILAFIHCLLLNVIYAIDGVWSPYSGLRLIQLLLCPATIGFVAWAIISIKRRKVIPQ